MKTPNAKPSSSRRDDANAFLPETSDGQHRASDAEYLAEEMICSATMGESVSEDAMDEVGEDEDGGPFIVLDDHARLPRVSDDEESGDVERNTGGTSVKRESVTRAALWVSRN